MKRIRTKITLTYVLLTLFVVVSVDILISVNIESFLKQRIVNDLNRQADVLSYTLRKAAALSPSELHAQMKTISGLQQVRVTFIDGQGAVLLDSDVPFEETAAIKNHRDRPEIQQAERTGLGQDVRLSATLDRPFLYVAKKIAEVQLLNGASVRFIRLSVPLEDVEDQMGRARSIVIMMGLLVLLTVIAVSLLLSKRITGPLEDISAGVEHIRSGDLDKRLAITTRDETGQVARAINELVEKLQKDIAERKKLEHVRSQFLGNVSHELRTPIFAIQGFLETLLDGAINDPSVNKVFLERAMSNLSRLNVLLEDLINISQIESGELKMSFRFFRLNEFVESLAANHMTAAAERNITLSITPKTTPDDELFGDRSRLQQVMNNLIMNAINYNKNGGTVQVSAERTGEGIELSVRDSGVGIPPEHLTRIFERFYRVDSDRSREMGGTGLGLAIVKHIIEAHGGRITVESTIGEGTVFRVTLKSN
ncbi:MAG: ATP-binding protein [Ignavibacteriales bacterium]|nr:ATP-binding protein [Ignavibacteriales bacterium]